MNIHISIVQTTYKRWPESKRSLDAIFEQVGLPAREILVVNDDPSSGLPEWLLSRAAANRGIFRVIHRSSNGGLAQARNDALQNARGKFITFCDDDDEWEPHTLLRLLQPFQDSSAHFSVGLGTKTALNRGLVDMGVYSLRTLFERGVTPPVSCQVFQTSILRVVNGFGTHIESGVDHDLWVRLLDVNPQVMVRAGVQSHAITDMAATRMTSSPKREQLIARSIQVWRPTLVAHFGPSYAKSFSRSYSNHLRLRRLHLLAHGRDPIVNLRLILRLRGLPGFLRFLVRRYLNRGTGFDAFADVGATSGPKPAP